MRSNRGLSTLACLAALAQVACTCEITFDEPEDLANLTYAEQCTTFVTSGNWFRQSCPGNRTVTVKEEFPQYNHWHLSWEDPDINCFAADNCFGREVGNTCQVVDHTTEPRFLATHVGDHWIELEVSDTPFEIRRIRVRTEPIDLWIQKSSGQWLWWPDLGPGYWATEADDLIAIRIHSSQPLSFAVDDIRLKF